MSASARADFAAAEGVIGEAVIIAGFMTRRSIADAVGAGQGSALPFGVQFPDRDPLAGKPRLFELVDGDSLASMRSDSAVDRVRDKRPRYRFRPRARNSGGSSACDVTFTI